jgi:uroporphyrin-3 C-methyltransferase
MSDPQTPDSPPPAAATTPAPDAAAAPAVNVPPRAAVRASAPSPQSSSTSTTLFATTMAIGVLGFAGLGFYALQQQQVLTRLAADYEDLRQASSANDVELNALRQADGQLEQSLRTQLQESDNQFEQTVRTQLQQAQDAQRTQLDNLNRELAALRTRVNDGGAGASTTLRLSEVGALLRLAQERLLSARDVRAAIGLMQSTDELLRQGNDSSTFTLREALAQDLTALRGVEAVDVSGLYARLGAAITRLEALAVQPGGAVPAFRVADTAATAETASWWDELKDFLGRYFVITRGAAEVVPVLGTEQTWVVEAQLKLQLEQARLALLQGQQSVFERALDEAISGIDALMQGDDKSALLTELHALRASAVQNTIPAAGRALEVLRALQPPETTTP